MPHHHTLLPFFPSPYAYFYDYDRSGDSAVSSIFKLILCKFCSLNLAIRIWRRIISDFLRWPDQKMLFCAIMLFLWETLRAQERRNCRSSVFKFYLSPRLRFFLMPIPTVCRFSTKNNAQSRWEKFPERSAIFGNFSRRWARKPFLMLIICNYAYSLLPIADHRWW